MHRSIWSRPNGQIRVGGYGLGGRSFFVSAAKCQAPEHACLAPQAQTFKAQGWRFKDVPMNLEPRTFNQTENKDSV